MFSWRKYIHKISAINAVTDIPCDIPIAFSGNFGVFIFDVNVGTEIGTVVLNHEAFGVPDRFQIEYDGVVVADSLYVGDSLSGNPPNYSGMVGNTYNAVPEYNWDGNQFVLNGNTQNISIVQGDIAPFGSTAGAGSISFEKVSTTPTVMTVRVFAPLGGTAWNLSTECPSIIGIGCAEALNFESDDQAGRYYTDVLLGTDGGLVQLDYEPGNIPDRFQIEYNGVIVADSKLVGGYLTGNPPDANTALWEGGAGSGMFVGHVYNGLKDYEWNGVDYTDAGTTTNNTVQQSDVGDFGFTASTGTLSFVKPAGLPSTMKIITTAFPANTGFNLTPSCPTVEPTNLKISTTSNSSTWSPNTIVNGGSTLRWDATNGIVYGKTVDDVIFDFSTNLGTVDMYVYDTTNVTNLNLQDLDVVSIDLTGNVNLQDLNIGENSLSTLDVSDNVGLIGLSCYINGLTALDVSSNVNLTALSCFTNNISALDVSNNLDLTFLSCADNNLTTLDVTVNTDLTTLECGENNLTTLDISNNVLLTDLNCDNNSLTSLDVSTNTALSLINCLNNSISTLDISTNTSLVNLNCRNNSLTNLDITSNTLLSSLTCNDNSIVGGDIDAIIIQLDTNGLSNGFLNIPTGRTVASDTARANLLGKGWSITEA